MKKRICFLGAAALVLILGACGAQTQTESPVGEQRAEPTPVVTAPPPVVTSLPPVVTAEPLPLPVEPEPTQKPVRPALTLEPVIPTPEPERPSDEEVLDAYQAAKEAYSWFEGHDHSGLLVDEGDLITLQAPVGGEEWSYCRVNRPGLGSVDELRAYLKKLFSDEVVDDLLKPTEAMFTDGPEGGLYVRTSGFDIGTTETEQEPVTLEVLWQEEGPPTCTVQAAAEALDISAEEGTAEKIYAYPYQKVGDKWVFTQFESIM